MAALATPLGELPAEGTFPGKNGRILLFREDQRTPSGLYSISPDGTRLRKVRTGECGGSSLKRRQPFPVGGRYSASGKRIVAVEHRCAGYGFSHNSLMTMSANGKHVRRLDSGDYRHPVFSPNGKRLAVLRFLRGDRDEFQLQTIGIGGKGTRVIASGSWAGGITGIEWAPRGGRLLVGHNTPNLDAPTIQTMRPDGSDRKTLASGWDPSWGPKGKRIVFRRKGPKAAKIMTMRPSGTRLKVLAKIRGFKQIATPMYSPDGRKIVFTGHLPGHRGIRVCTISTRGGSPNCLTPPAADFVATSWQPR